MSRDGRSSARFGGLAFAAIALLLAGCTSAAGSPKVTSTASPEPIPTTSLSPSAEATYWDPALSTPTPSWQTEETLEPSAEPTPTPTPPLPKGPLPSVGPAPTGTWTGITWLAIPGGHSPAVAPMADDWYPNGLIEGWSQGYVEFVWNRKLRTLTPWASSDGLNWAAGAKVDLSPWAAYFKEYDADNDPEYPDPGWHDNCYVTIDNFQEGPGVLLMSGYVTCYEAGACATWDTPNFMSSVPLLWTSADGLAWTPAPPLKRVGWAGPTISGGSSGFITIEDLKLRTSLDGRAWQDGTLPVLERGESIGQPVAIAGGYVLPGVVKTKRGHITAGSGGCIMDGSDLSQYEGALWWSADGISWTPDSIPSVVASYRGVSMRVDRIDDHTLVAQELVGEAVIEWVSSDGKAWSRLKGAPVDYFGGNVVAGRDRGLIVGDTGGDQPVRTFSAFGADMSLVTLKQTGAMPWIDTWQMALGPTGLLVTEDGTRFWLGVPTAG